jgi:hypothetical protein
LRPNLEKKLNLKVLVMSLLLRQPLTDFREIT